MKKKIIRSYIRSVTRLLPCSQKQKRAFKKQLDNDITNFLLDNSNTNIELITEHFGTPQQIASSYIHEMGSQELQQGLHIRKNILIAVFSTLGVILLIWFGVAIGAFLDAVTSNDGHVETSPIITNNINN